MPTRHDDTPFLPRKILLIKLRHHGDMILTTPVINNLRQHYPVAEIDVLLYKKTTPILAHHSAIGQIHVIDRQWKKQDPLRQLEQEFALAQTLCGAIMILSSILPINGAARLSRCSAAPGAQPSSGYRQPRATADRGTKSQYSGTV